MEKRYNRGKHSKLLIYSIITAAFLASLVGCGPSYKNVKIDSAKNRHSISLSRNIIHHYIDEIGKSWIITDPYERVKKKGKSSSRLKNIVEVIPPEGSKRIRTRRGLERALDITNYKPLEIVTTVSPKSKEKSVAGHIYEGKDPNPHDDDHTYSKAERLSRKEIQVDVKFIKKERKEGGGDGNGGGGGNGGGVGGAGGGGGSTGG